MSRGVIKRTELVGATLRLGSAPMDLTPYATTGLRIVTVGPSGIGKTNSGLLIGEQLAKQGWVSVFIDPEGEIASMYGDPVASPQELRKLLEARSKSIIVVAAKDATEFIPYGRELLHAADTVRKPMYVMLDEGQLVSAGRKRANDIGEASDIVNDLAERGRKRALDLFMTAHRFTASLHRSIFANANLKFIGAQMDPTAWSALAPQFRGSRIEFTDLAALAPGEFFCFSRRGVEKLRMPMAEALSKVAPKAVAVRRTLPATFSEWDRAMRAIPTDRLTALDDDIVSLMSAVAGLPAQKVLSGQRALAEELETR